MSKLVLEEVPPSWTTVRIGEISKLMYGKALRADNRASEGGIPVYGSSGLVGQHNEALHSEPSIIIGRKGTVGAIYLTKEPFWAIDTTFYLAKINPVVNLDFFAYILRLIDLSRLSIAVAVPGIRRQDIESEKIPLPPLPEQHRIVAILRQVDELCYLRKKVNEQAGTLVQGVFYNVFGSCDPSSSYPAGWKVVKFKKLIADTQYGLSNRLSDMDDVPVLRMNNITAEGGLDLLDLKYIHDLKADFEKYDLRDGDLLFNRTNSIEHVGKTGLWEEQNEKYTFASYLIRIRLKDDVLPEYIWGIMNSPYGKFQTGRLAKQAVNMANINVNELKSILVVVPPKPLQEKFAKVVNEVKKHLYEYQESKKGLNKLLQSMLSGVFTGELTAAWREEHRHELREAAAQRDAILGRVRQATLDLTDEATYHKFAREVAGLTSEAVRELLYVLNNLSNLDFSRQWQFLALVEQVQKGLPEYVEQVNRILHAVVTNINHELQIKLAQEYDSLASQTSETLKEVDLNDKAGFHATLALALSTAAVQAQKEADERSQAALQSWRTVRSQLDTNTQALLRVVEGRPAYFRPAELVASREQLDLVTAEERLHLLTALGLVRPVRLQGERVYRVVNPDAEKAPTISESS